MSRQESLWPWGPRRVSWPGPESVQVVSHVPWSPTPELFQAQGSQDFLSPLLVW